MADEHLLTIGSSFGAYRIDSFIGRGGMGEVYAAQHLALDRPCALKIALVELLGEKALMRWQREATSMVALKHPNIVELYDSGTVDDRPYLAMELVRGQNLDVLHRWFSPFTLQENLWIFSQLTKALVAVHAAELVHRDLKAANVMISFDGCLKLMDFGLVLRPFGTQLTDTGLAVGTPEWIAPEMIMGTDATDRTDCYLAGELFFFCLTGQSPWGEGSWNELALSKLERAVDVEGALPAAVPRELRDLIAALLEREPQARPAMVECHVTIEKLARKLEATPGRLAKSRSNDPRETGDLPAKDRPTARLVPQKQASHQQSSSPKRRRSWSFLLLLICGVLSLLVLFFLLERSKVADGKHPAGQPRTTDTTISPAVPVLLREPVISGGPGWFAVDVQLEKPSTLRAVMRLTNRNEGSSHSQTNERDDYHRFVWQDIPAALQHNCAVSLKLEGASQSIYAKSYPSGYLQRRMQRLLLDVGDKRLRWSADLLGNRLIVGDSVGRIHSLPWPDRSVSPQEQSTAAVIWNHEPKTADSHFLGCTVWREDIIAVTGSKTLDVLFLRRASTETKTVQQHSRLSLPLPAGWQGYSGGRHSPCVYGSKLYISIIDQHRSLLFAIDLERRSHVTFGPVKGVALLRPVVVGTTVYWSVKRRAARRSCTYAFAWKSLKKKWHFTTGPLRQPIASAGGWLWLADGKGIYRIHPKRSARKGRGRHRQRGLQPELEEGFIAIPGAMSPPLLKGSRGWVATVRQKTQLLLRMGIPGFAHFDWKALDDLQSCIEDPYHSPRTHSVTECLPVEITRNKCIHIVGCAVYAVPLDDPRRYGALIHYDFARAFVQRGNRLGLLGYNRVYQVTIHP